jgi:hypothetical protein
MGSPRSLEDVRQLLSELRFAYNQLPEKCRKMVREQLVVCVPEASKTCYASDLRG